MRRELREAGFRQALVEANLKGLQKLIGGLQPPAGPTEWSDYGKTCNYLRDEDTGAKEEFVRAAVRRQRRTLVWDLGANDGRYSRIAAEGSDTTIALDADAGVVERLYLALKHEGTQTILPLVGDVADPSPALGWRGRERLTLVERGRPNLVLALALVHHLVIGRTIPQHALIDWLAEASAASSWSSFPTGMTRWCAGCCRASGTGRTPTTRGGRSRRRCARGSRSGTRCSCRRVRGLSTTPCRADEAAPRRCRSPVPSHQPDRGANVIVSSLR